MSDLQKSFAKSKLAKLPPEPPPIPEYPSEEDDRDDGDSNSSTETVTPSPTKQLFARPGGARGYDQKPRLFDGIL
jgi:protein phosphatase methylesterase 1